MVGRRGVNTMLYEIIISLVLLGIFAAATFPYIYANANGEAYFSRFYATDIATTAELVNAGYGDVVIRYDNLKQTMDLSFVFDNGAVAVGKPAEGMLLADAVPKFFLQVPANFAVQRYGKAERFESIEPIQKPAFLTFRKTDEVFSIAESETQVKSCPVVDPIVKREDAKVHLSVNSAIDDDEEQLRLLLQHELKQMNIPYEDDEKDATIRIKIDKHIGEKDTVVISPSSDDAKAYSCLFIQRLEAISLAKFEKNEPASFGSGMFVRIGITINSPVTNAQIAKAMANALAVYY